MFKLLHMTATNAFLDCLLFVCFEFKVTASQSFYSPNFILYVNIFIGRVTSNYKSQITVGGKKYNISQ